MADWYVSSVGYAAVAQWSAGDAVSPGAFRRQLTTPAAGNERVWRCTTGGTTGGTEPTWNLNLNSTTNDNGVVWTECTGQSAYQSAGNWTAPAATLDLIIGSGGRAGTSGTDNCYVAHDHAEVWAAGRTWNSLAHTVCVTMAGSALPPLAASLATGATVTMTGASGLGLGRSGYFYGVAFSIGTGASAASLSVGTTAAPGTVTMENCSIALATTAAGSRIGMGTTGVISNLQLVNTPVSFGAAGQGIVSNTGGSTFAWHNTPNAIQGTSPTNLLIAGAIALVEIVGVDLSGLVGNIVQTGAGGNAFSGNVFVTGCRLNASTVFAANLRTASRNNKLVMTNSDSATGNNIVNAVYGSMAATGGIRSNTTVYRDDGANAGGSNPYSWSIDASPTTAGAPSYQYHPITPAILFWNIDTGASRTITVHGIANKAALPTNAMVFLDVQFLGSSASPLASVASGGTGPLLPSSPASTTPTAQVWDDGVSARLDSTAYSFGNEIKVASNPGRVFFCITAGTTASSEPAGYATASDGTSVVDGTATFRAGYRFSVSVTVTPEKEGWIGAFVHYIDAQADVTRIYIDPLAIVT
jgi:hypothetical protein